MPEVSKHRKTDTFPTMTSLLARLDAWTRWAFNPPHELSSRR